MANILVVDDDKVLLTVLQTALIKAGHSVLGVEDARVALEKLEQEIFDMIITDINMPGGVSGFNLMTTIRKIPKFANLPAIFLSGRRDKSDVIKAMEAGVDDYLVKPLDIDLLFAKVEALLEKKPGSHSFTPTPIDQKGKWDLNFQITGISEQGLVLSSAIPLPNNFKLKIDSDLFDELEMRSPLLRVGQCVIAQGPQKIYIIRANFIGLSVGELQKIRLWIMSSSKTNKIVS